MKKLFAVAAACLLLNGCAAVPVVSAVSAISDVVASKAVRSTHNTVTIEGTRALVLAHNAYQGAAELATLAIKSGRLSDDQVRKIVQLNNRATAILEDTGEALTATKKAAALFALADEINRALGR